MQLPDSANNKQAGNSAPILQRAACTLQREFHSFPGCGTPGNLHEIVTIGTRTTIKQRQPFRAQSQGNLL